MNNYLEYFNKEANYYINLSNDENQRYNINRKIEHCKRVNEVAIKIANKLKLNSNEIMIVNIASLFHDIARFKQFYLYNTYIDNESFDHQIEGVKMLEDCDILLNIDASSKEIIKNIILTHDMKYIPSYFDSKTKLLSSIVRDADKIDRIYAMIYIISNNTKEVQKVFYSNKDELNYVSKDIVDKILRNEVVLKQDVNTVNELKLANISLVVSDIKNKPSLDLLLENNYINMAFDLIDESEEKNIVRKHIESYITSR